MSTIELTLDERAAVAALINNEISEGSSKFGAHGHRMVRLDDLLDKFENLDEDYHA